MSETVTEPAPEAEEAPKWDPREHLAAVQGALRLAVRRVVV